MKEKELERKISELIAEIGNNRIPVRPEKEWLQEKYERYKQRLEEREGRKLTRIQTDERLYQELYHTAPLKDSQVTKIRYWRSGRHFPGKYSEVMAFADALGLNEEEIQYFFRYYLDQNYFPGKKERDRAVVLLDELKEEFQQKIHPSWLLRYGIRERNLSKSFRMLYFERASGYVNLTSETRGGKLNPQNSISFGSELTRIQKMEGQFSRKSLIRHLIVLGSPFVSVEQMNCWLEILGCGTLKEEHTSPEGYQEDLLVIRMLELYEEVACGLEPEDGRALLCYMLACMDRELREQGMQELCFMYFKALRGCTDGK